MTLLNVAFPEVLRTGICPNMPDFLFHVKLFLISNLRNIIVIKLIFWYSNKK